MKQGDLVWIDYPTGRSVGVIIRRVTEAEDSEVLVEYYDWWVLIEGVTAAYPEGAMTLVREDDASR